MTTCAACGASQGPFVTFGIPGLKVCGSPRGTKPEDKKKRVAECNARSKARHGDK